MEKTVTDKKRRKKKWLIAILIIAVILLIARLILPYVVLQYVNKTLSELKEYEGHVEDIDIALIRGAYKIKEIRLDKKDSVTNKLDSIPFFRSTELDLSVQWSAIFKGAFVGEIYVTDQRCDRQADASYH
jgi:branched-subunit amino acid transport protein AzlD